MQFGELKLKACKYGWMLFGGKYIGKCFDLYGQYSESEVAMMRSFLREGSIVIDVGANIGDLTLPLARIVGSAGRVYAIESNPVAFNVLCANLALNSVTNTKPLNVYITPESQGLSRVGAWGEAAYVGKNWEPDFVTLDSLDPPRCDLIKIDVDGAELAILESGAMLIEKHRPILYFENDTRVLSQPLLDYAMRQLGYDLYWHPAPIFDPDNFFGDPTNHWAPDIIVSLMIVGVPKEIRQELKMLRKISSADDWWDGLLGP